MTDRWPVRRRVLSALVVLAVAGGGAISGARRPEWPPGLANGPDWRGTTVTALTAGVGIGASARNSAGGVEAAVREGEWLGSTAWSGPPTFTPTVAQALRDLRDLQLPNGAVLAGPADAWAYVWPRDTAFVAAAFAAAGHRERAWAALRFLAARQNSTGGFEARYRPDGSTVPDGRPAQSDGCGWVLWGLDEVRRLGGSPVPADLVAMRDRCLADLETLTARGTHLPPPSPDYWELSVSAVTLGTVAPMVAGLQAGARLVEAQGQGQDLGQGQGQGDHAQAVRLSATRLLATTVAAFGPMYERYGDRGGLDAAALMLMPPFVEHGTSGPDERLVAASRAYPAAALRFSGGVAPGAAWKKDGISWTPETALIAYEAAADGDTERALTWLAWLDEHRTRWGSLPEKVLRNGQPAGPAPLAWTSALVVLTARTLADRHR